MKKINLLLLVCCILFVFSCQKENIELHEIDFKTTTNLTFPSKSNSLSFFNLDNRLNSIRESKIENRTKNNSDLTRTYHPDIIELYSYLEDLDKSLNFSENVINNVGYPLWSKSKIITSNSENLIILPFINIKLNETAGIMFAIKNSSGYFINATNKYNKTNLNTLEIITQFTSEQKIVQVKRLDGLREMIYYDKILFENEDANLVEEYCKLKGELPIDGIISTISNPVNCQWKIMERCSDDETQSNWWASTCKAPPTIDHDQDCIPNEDDQDYLDLLNRYEITNEEFRDYFNNWWNENFGEDYDWEAYFEYYDQQDWWDDYSYLDNFWDDFWDSQDTDGGQLGPGQLPENDSDYYGNLPCYWDDPLKGNNNSNNRDVLCQNFHVLCCQNELGSWIQEFTFCPACPNYLEGDDNGQLTEIYKNSMLDKYKNLYDVKDIYNTPGGLFMYSIVNDCDFFAPEEVLFQCFTNKLIGYFSANYNVQNFTIDEWSQILANPEYISILIATFSYWQENSALNIHNLLNGQDEEYQNLGIDNFSNFITQYGALNYMLMLNSWNKFKNYIDLSIEQLVWLAKNKTTSDEIYNDLEQTQYGLDYKNYISRIIYLKMDDNAIRFDRAKQLYDLIEENPDQLIDECGDISNWSDLASFVPPQTVLDKLESLGEEWRVQYFTTPTAAPRINLDYFSTTITQMPIKNQTTGELWTQADLFDHFRKNINDFVDTDLSEFTPISGDEVKWMSSNPVPSVISIDIGGPDNGSIICSDYQCCCWIFTTVTAPLLPGYDRIPSSKW